MQGFMNAIAGYFKGFDGLTYAQVTSTVSLLLVLVRMFLNHYKRAKINVLTVDVDHFDGINSACLSYIAINSGKRDGYIVDIWANSVDDSKNFIPVKLQSANLPIRVPAKGAGGFTSCKLAKPIPIVKVKLSDGKIIKLSNLINTEKS